MGTADRRRRESHQRRQEILAAARKLFWAKGYTKATVAHIAQEVELAPGTIYLYFPNKDALYVALLMEGYELFLDRLKVATRVSGSPVDRASGLIKAFFGFARDFPEYFDIIFFVLQKENCGGWEDNFPVEQVERLREWEASCKRLAAEILEAIDFESPQTSVHLTDAIWSMLAGVVLYSRNTERFDAVAKEAERLLLSAVFGEDRPSPPAVAQTS